MGSIVRFVVIVCCYIFSNACWYRVGREHGATDVMRHFAGVITLTSNNAGVISLASKNDYNKLKAENAKLRELVRGLIYATHPADRARLIADAAEFGIEVGE